MVLGRGNMGLNKGIKPGTGIITLLFIFLALASATVATHTNTTDYDSDTILNDQDNCPFVANSGRAGELVEGHSGSFTIESVTYTVTLDFVDADEARFTVTSSAASGAISEATPKLREDEAYFLNDHTKIIVQEIFYQDYATGIHGARFLIGAQKDSDRNGIGDACPHYGNEEDQVLKLQEQFEDLEDEYFTLKNAYKKNPVENKVKLGELQKSFANLREDLRELMADIDENNSLENQNQLGDVLDELEEDVVRVKGRITDLLAQNNSQEQPLSTYSNNAYSESQAIASPMLTELSTVPSVPRGSKVTVLKFSLLSPTEENPGPVDNDLGIFWLITAIAIVLIMLLFLILAGMRGKA